MEDDETFTTDSFEGDSLEGAVDELEPRDEPLPTPNYSPGDIVEVEVSEDTPEWMAYQVGKMRDQADEVRDLLDIYDRFQEEEWSETPSEVDDFLQEKGYRGEEDRQEWLAEKAAEEAVKLTEQRDLITDTYNGKGLLPGGGKAKDIEAENSEKIEAEIGYATITVEKVEKAGATREGGFTPPYPSVDTEPENSLGHTYRQKLDESAEDVDWAFNRIQWE